MKCYKESSNYLILLILLKQKSLLGILWDKNYDVKLYYLIRIFIHWFNFPEYSATIFY